MIPLVLKLYNFMCYRDEVAPIDFRGLHLVCLAGDNGSGKSSMLDAMTWVLWGEARTRSADELVHQGESEMEVDLVFAVEGDVYRVIRRRKVGKVGKSSLELQSRAPSGAAPAADFLDSAGWRVLTGATIRETQDAINRLLHLDYVTFVNSAFLVQGRADEFTRRTPSERKKVLADILGLGVYDDYEKRAGEKARAVGEEIARIEGLLGQIDGELAREDDYKRELREAEEESERVGGELKEAEDALSDLQGEYRELDLKDRQLQEAVRRMEGLEVEVGEAREALEDSREKAAACRDVMGRGEEIEAGFAAFQEAERGLASWDERLAKAHRLGEQKAALEGEIGLARERLEGEARNARRRLEELDAAAKNAPQIEAELATTRGRLAGLDELRARRDELAESLGGLEREDASLKEQNNRLRDEMDEIKERLEKLVEAGAECPLCGQPLDESHRDEMTAALQSDGKQKGDAFRANRSRVEEIAGERVAIEKEAREADVALRDVPQLQKEEGRQAAALEAAEKAKEAMQPLGEELASIEGRLQDRDYAREEQAALDALLAELAEVGYDEAAHAGARAVAESLSHFREEMGSLERASENLAEEERRQKKLQEQLARWQKKLEAEKAGVDSLREEVADLPGVRERLEETRGRVEGLSAQDRTARDRVAAARQKLKWCADLREERTRGAAELDAAREEQSLYRELQLAFGKKGVQAMLIETALPEIEEEANRLLARMTGGRMNIQFETQREAKTTSSVLETLDIRIADELGTRSYDMYSGGEAFRIDFAIRIALSRLLARRSGARLRTLVIDEGFGTQDAQGRTALVDAIRTIQDDFDLLLVITHVEDIQERFPARINVQKTPQGSRVEVIGG